MKQKVFNLIILDESGSMFSIEEQTVSGLNETIQTIKSAQCKHAEQEHFVTLMSFNSNHRTYHYDCEPVMNIGEFDGKNYQPNCCTPLLDAIGDGISKLHTQIDANDKVLVTIITDGYENASKEYNNKAITKLIDKMRGEGWMITYLGANQDAHKVAEDLHINNAMNFDASSTGVQHMFCNELKRRGRFYDKIDLDCIKASKDNYFDDDKN